jgi:tetratricopeptide (TPR) repeat protein
MPGRSLPKTELAEDHAPELIALGQPRREGRTVSPWTFPDARGWRCPQCSACRACPRRAVERCGYRRRPHPRCARCAGPKAGCRRWALRAASDAATEPDRPRSVSIPAFLNLARRLRKHFDAIIASVHLGLSNSRLEGINSKIRVIQRRGYGFRDAFDADESGRDDALEALLRDLPDDQLDAEPTCLLFVAERAITRGHFDPALALYERACRRHPGTIGGRLGKARVLIERMIRGRSALPSRDQQEAVELATSVRDEIRRWAGPSENAHRLIVQERMLVGAFMEVITLATPAAFGGEANDREAIDPIIAILGAQASVALGDYSRAGRFGDAMRDTPTEPVIRAIGADPNQPHLKTVTMWRTALDGADSAFAARVCLHELAARGALDVADLPRIRALANLDDEDRTLFTARNVAAARDLDSAIGLLRSQRSPAAGEMLIELLGEAGRYDEALAVCEVWASYRALKVLQHKVNILAMRGDIAAAEACAAQLLATGELAAEQRHQIHSRLIQQRMAQADWAGAEAYCRAALKDQPDDDNHAWGLITAQLNQSRWDAAWASYCQLVPDVRDPTFVPAWVDLHLRFGITPEARNTAVRLIGRFERDQDALAHLVRQPRFVM